MKIKKLIIYLFLSLFVTIFLIYLYNTCDLNDVFSKNKTIYYSTYDIFANQKEINDEILKYKNSNEYTFENPKIILNPYEISPLTALIIFKTDKNVIINVNINGEYITDYSSSKEHLIPIYGLYENKSNEIILTMDNDKTKKIFITTEKSVDVNKLTVKKSDISLNNDLYFMTSPVGTSASAYDKNGNLKWYLTEDFVMDFEWLENGHFLVGLPQGSVNDRKIGFVEMDYLGKIYNYYISKYGYEFEFQVLSNGNYMLCGGNTPIFYDHAYVYEINSKTGEIASYIDLYEIFKSVDKNFDTEKLNWKIIRNAFYYNEKNNELILSLRGLNSVVSINYKTQKINYIFAPPNIYSDNFDKYMVSLENGRYPLGIHSVFMTKEGYIGFINNGYDRLHGHEVGEVDLVSSYKNNYTSAEIYKIDDMKASLIWEYDANKKYFSHQYGSFEELQNNNKLINFGWVLSEEYKNNSSATLSESEKSTNHTYSLIVEMNENDILFKATIEDGKYRVFKHSLYNKESKNFDSKIYNSFNTIPRSKIKSIYTKNIIDNLDNAENFNHIISYTKNTLDTDYVFDSYDSVDILFVSKHLKSYIYNYKKENEKENKLMNIDLKKGEYALYLIINDVYYNTNIIVEY